MIKPAYLEAAAGLIEVYYSNLQEALIRDIVDRLLHTNFEVSGTTAWRMEKLQEAGLLYDEAIKRIADATGKSEKELKRLFENAGVEVFNYGDAVYAALGIKALRVQSTPDMLKALSDGYQNTKGTMRNLTGTSALDVKGTFIFACDMAYKAIASGGFSYSEAIARAVETVGKSGVFVRYPTGHRDRVDVAARRAVLAGLGKTVGRLTEMACEELGCDLVEVTAHFNARPSHAEWQGKVYSRSGKSKTYPDFSVCGYGTGAGLMGWNCYHSFHPFFEGISERAYTDAELQEMRDATVTYNGERISGYEATKIQRSIERQIRESKRMLIAYDEGIKQSTGAEKRMLQLRYAEERKRLSKLNAELNAFVKQTGLHKQYNRSRVLGFGRSQAQKAASTGRRVLTSGQKNDSINTRENVMHRKKKADGFIEPMPKKQLLRIEKAFKRNGGIIQRDATTDVYLQKKQSEAITIDAKTILLMQKPGRASVFEELIHATQYRLGENNGSLLSRIQCEIAAQEKLLKNAKAYKLTEKEVLQTRKALEAYKRDIAVYFEKAER